MRVAGGICALTVFIVVAASGVADAAEIRVYSSGAPAQAAKAIAANFSAQTGHQITFTVAQPATIEGELAAGDRADIVILPSPAIALLNTSGALRAGSAVALARVGIGIVVRDGMNRPDISNAAAIRKLLLDAHSIVYPDPRSGGGSTGRAIARMIDQMGITDAVKAKLTRTSAIGGGVDLVAGGQAEVGLFNISEILPIKGVTLIGPLPAEVQNYIVFTAAIPASNATPDPAVSFINVLAGPAARQAWQGAGLEPLPAAP
jgi:molybdate transport system substrate-binding protein